MKNKMLTAMVALLVFFSFSAVLAATSRGDGPPRTASISATAHAGADMTAAEFSIDAECVHVSQVSTAAATPTSAEEPTRSNTKYSNGLRGTRATGNDPPEYFAAIARFEGFGQDNRARGKI